MLSKIKVPPLSVYEFSVCNNVGELCQLRDICIYIYITDITAMVNNVCTE